MFDTYAAQIHSTLNDVQRGMDVISQQQDELYQQLCKTRDDSITDEEIGLIKARMDRTKEYYGKLMQLRAAMVNMSIKSKQLLKRSEKMKAIKLDYLSKVDEIRQREQARDQAIAAELPPSLQQPLEDEPEREPEPVGSLSASQPLPSSPSTPITPLADPNSLTRTSSTSSLPLAAIVPSSSSSSLVKSKKKKRKPKAREVEIDDGLDEPAWVPRRTPVPKKS
ncbi:hypothetical protein DM01DRAFT_1404455 [Hesseltinella vesiculosa]|uniref:Uncharacterized protein n=1 Tax=Hesseltinella vesiculosa TaxID=101127 RepID=A0A1X2GUK1_9FUNG|nr:hypothetical protein DM01DRAFT_1404455 [Hesseltinella vesiculosa]